MNLKFWTWFSKPTSYSYGPGSTIIFYVDENSIAKLKVEFGSSDFPAQAKRFANLVQMINDGQFKHEFLAAAERACNRQCLVGGIQDEIIQSLTERLIANDDEQEEMDPEHVFAMNSERRL